MRKFIATFVCLLMLVSAVAGLSACNTRGDDGVDEQGNVTQIIMWVGGSEWSGQNLRNLQAFMDAYNEAKPDGFEVKLERKDDLEKAFQTARTQGKQPDLMLWDRFNTATNVVSDYLYPVTELIERDKVDTSVFYGPAMQEMIYGEETYGLPVDIDVWGTYVNMDFVEEYDKAHPDSKIEPLFDADWTWDDLLTAAKALKTVAEAGYSAGDQYEHLFKYYVSTGHGEEFLLLADESTGRYRTNFDNQWTRDILTFFKEVSNANVGGKQETTSFVSSILAMVNNPLYYNNYIKSDGRITNYKFLPQPRQSEMQGVNGGMIGGYGLAFPKPDEKYQTRAWEARHEAAWKFTKWLCLDKGNMLSWSKQIGSLPALTEAMNDPSCVEGNQVLQDARTYVTKTDAEGNYIYITRPQVPNFLTLQTDVINTQVQRFLSGALSIDDYIKQLTESGDQRLGMGLQ